MQIKSWSVLTGSRNTWPRNGTQVLSSMIAYDAKEMYMFLQTNAIFVCFKLLNLLACMQSFARTEYGTPLYVYILIDIALSV